MFNKKQKIQNKKRIDQLVIINDRSLPVGGASLLAILNAKLASKKGIKTVFISGDNGPEESKIFKKIKYISLNLSQINPQKPVNGFLPGLWNFSSLAKIQSWIQINDTPRTVYHVHGWSKFLSPSIFYPLKKVIKRVIIHAHDFFLTCPNGGIYNYATQKKCPLNGGSLKCFCTNCDSRNYAFKIWRFARTKILQETSFKKSAKIVLIHEKMKKNFRKNGFRMQNILVLKNPVTPYTKKRTKAENNKKFYFIGRLEKEKGCLDFLEAAKYNKVLTAVIGEGSQDEILRKKFPTTTFYGWQNKNKIKTILRDARCLVLPTKYPEPYGLVAVEALGSGIPVIISSSAFLAESVKKYKMGLIFSAKTNNLNRAIKLFKNNDSKVAKFSKNSFQKWNSLCTTPKQWFSKLNSLYLQTLLK